MIAEPITELNECAICLEELDGSYEEVQLKNCGHLFHKSCFKEWIAKLSKVTNRFTVCPYCKTIDTIDFRQFTNIDDIKHVKKHYGSFPRPPINLTDILIWGSNTRPSETGRHEDYVDNLTGLCPMPHFLDREPLPPENASFQKLEELYSSALNKYEIAKFDNDNAQEYNSEFLRKVLRTKKRPMTKQEQIQNASILFLTTKWLDEADDRLGLIGLRKWKAYIREEKRIQNEEAQGKTVRGRLTHTLRGITKTMPANSRKRLTNIIPLLEDTNRIILPPKPKIGTQDYLNYRDAERFIAYEDCEKGKMHDGSEGSCIFMGGKHNKSKKKRNRKHRKAKKSRKQRK